MKKIYFLLVAACICLSANADWYLRGSMNGWGTDLKFEQKGDKYVIENVEIPAKAELLVNDGDWSGTKYGEWDGYAKNMKGGNKYKCHKGGGNMSFGDAKFTGNVEFWIDGTDGWAYINFVNPEGEPVPDPEPDPEPADLTFYLIGQFNEWTLKDADYAFTKDGDTYTLSNVNLKDGTEFKINAGSWADHNFGGDGNNDESIKTVDTNIGENTLWDGSSVNLVAKGITDATLSFTYTEGQNPITLNIAVASTPDPDPDPVVASYWLSGAFTGWEEGEIELKEENDWTATANCANTDAFGIRTRDAQGKEITFYMVLNASVLDADATLEMVPEKTEGAACPSVKRGFWSFTLDPEKMTLSVKKVSDYKMTYELRGIGDDWGTCQTAYAEGTIVKFVVEKWNENDEFKVWYYNDGSEHWKGVNTSDALQNGAWEAAGNNNAKLDPSADGKTVTIRFATDTESIKASWPETHQVRIAFHNGETQWDNVYAYFHVDGEAQHEWTAYKLTDTRENAAEQPEVSIFAVSDLKYCDVDLDFVPSHVVFHNGGIGSGNQTVDLVYKNNMTFAPSGQNDDGHYIVPDENVTGIESIINNADAAPVYYNLQGVRVDAPAQGLYIVVRGNKVAKEIVK